jgi:hypothetical protein
MIALIGEGQRRSRQPCTPHTPKANGRRLEPAEPGRACAEPAEPCRAYSELYFARSSANIRL